MMGISLANVVADTFIYFGVTGLVLNLLGIVDLVPPGERWFTVVVLVLALFATRLFLEILDFAFEPVAVDDDW